MTARWENEGLTFRGLTRFSGGSVSSDLLGERELRQLLNHLPDRIYRKVVRQVTAKMATPILKAAKRNLCKVVSETATGGLETALTKKTKTYKRHGTVMTVIGGRWPMGAHAHLVEKGHRMVVGGTAVRLGKRWSAAKSRRGWRGTGSGRVVGFVPAKPFMRPAWDAHKAQAMSIAEQALRVGVEREARKLSRLRASGAMGA